MPINTQQQQQLQSQLQQSAAQPFAPRPQQPQVNTQAIPQPVQQPEQAWDYKTAQVDPLGNPLPEGAQGFTPHGTPYFGPGLGGTLKKYSWMLTGDNPNKLISKVKDYSADRNQTTGKALVDELKMQALRFITPNEQAKDEDWKKLSELSKQTDTLAAQEKAVGMGGSEELQAARAATSAQLWKNLEGTSVLSPILKTAKFGITVLMDVFSEAAVKLEQIESVGLAMGDYVESQGGTSLQFDDSAQVADEKERGRNRALNIVRNIVFPVLQSVDSLKFVLAPGTFEDKKAAIATGWDAGKMLYSQTLQPSILEEFKRRAEAGEDPELLAQDLQNPWAEAVGQLALDPLNVVGMISKAAKIADVTKDASKLTKTVDELASVGDDLADLAKTPVNETSALEKLNKVDEGLQAALKKSDERITLQYGKGTDFSPAGFKTHWGKKVKSTSMLFTSAVMRAGGNTDDLADLAHYGSRLNSADKAARMKALDGYLELANKYKLGRTALSEMALDTWNLIGKMTEGKNADNLLLTLKKFKGDPAKFAEEAMKLMDNAVNYASPGYSELKNAAKAVAEGSDETRDLELAAKYEKLSPAAKKLQELEAGKLGNFKRTANNLLAKFYFGTYGPGVRNAMGNATHMIVDRGIGGTVSSFYRDGKYWSLVAIQDELKMYFGGQLPPDLGGLSLASASGDDIEKVLGVIPAKDGKILGVLPTPGKFTDDTEKAFATRIYWANFRDTFDKVMRPGVALPDMKTFKAAGMTENQVRDFVHIVKTETFGDIEKAIIKYGEKHAEGGLDAWRAWSGMVDENQMKGLRAVGMEQEINAIADMADATPQKIRDEFARLRRSIEARAKQATLDPKAISSAREEFAFTNDLGKAVDSGYMDGDGLGQLNQRLETAANAQDEAMAALGKARDKYNQLVGTGTAQPLDFSMIEQVGSESRKLAVRNKTTGITEAAWEITKKIKKGLTQSETQKLWDSSIMAGSPMPSSQEEILSELWRGTRFSVAQAWETHFAENFQKLQPLVESLKASDPSIAGLFRQADKASAEAQQMRSAVFHNNHIYVQPPARNIAEIASRYKIPTASQEGVPMWDRLANTLKKNGLDVSVDDLRNGNQDRELMRIVEDTLKQQGTGGKIGETTRAAAESAGEMTPFRRASGTEVPSAYEPNTYELRKGITRAERMKEIASYAEKYEGEYDFTAIRVQDKTYGAEVGKPLEHESFVWEDGEKLDETIGGISSIDINRAESLSNIGYKGNTILVLGSNSADTGEDVAELVLREPVVLDIIDDSHFFGNAAKSDAAKGADDAIQATEDISPTIEEQIASGELVEIAPKYLGDATPSDGRAWLENRQGYLDVLNSLERKMLDNYGLKAVDKLDNKTLKALKRTLLIDKDVNGLTAADKITEGIAMSDRVGKHWRDFGLLPYGETRNYDVMASYAYPYQFWYSRSYKNWMTRVATDPQVISNYARLKDAMAKENKDSPEWWRYNVEIPSHFLGLPNENPMSFNIEANIWPLYGLTGTDFNDPTKRADWWSATIDDMGKLGPSTWAPISWAVAAIYSAKGEDDVAARWAGGGMVPQTKLIRQVSSFFGQPVQIDPLVKLFAGGVDPYERNRVGRILGQYAQAGQLPDGTPITEEDLLEVARMQEGPIWDMAVRDAVRLRASGDLVASFLGVGLKSRPPEDTEIDKFYQDYHRLMSLSNEKLISPDKIRESYDALREKYPFMDTVLLARKAGDDRERAYSYNILSRVPPGQASDLYKIVDIDPATAQKFFDNGGDLSFLSESERKKFIAGMIDMGALLEIPDYSTKQEWNAARNEYNQMKEIIKQEFGKDVYDKIEHMYTLSGADRDAYREAHPELEDARQLENEYLTNNELLYTYYGGIETLQQYYNGKMYEQLDKKFGDVQPLFDHYYDLQLTDPKAATAFKKLHPEMDAYTKYKSGLQQDSLAKIVQFAAHLPDGPELDLRDDFNPANPTQQELYDYAQQGSPSPQEFQQELGSPLMNIVSEYYVNLMYDPSKAKLPYQANRELDFASERLGYESGDDLLRAILISLGQ